MKHKVINFFAGPGTGKSTTAAALFAELKYQGINTELVTEFAKDAAWERRGPKVFQAQEYIFGNQHFRLARVADEVDITIIDSPPIMGVVYAGKDFYLPSLRKAIKEAHDLYDNLNFFLVRNKTYNPKGRNQTYEEALQKDQEILDLLNEESIPYISLNFSRENIPQIVEILRATMWIL